MKESRLLELDRIGNVVLGLPLVFYPKVVAELLGIPYGDQCFYPTILGALLIGTGIALMKDEYVDIQEYEESGITIIKGQKHQVMPILKSIVQEYA